ncbi:MAG: carboxymuconolactone decarboxylase family protein [Proteobacteria bacterium]|nr:carboxymuconolactone decarboxylase family protein [Pseudomonadota bacterium]
MSRLPIPTTVESAPAASRASLLAVGKSLGSVPNLFRLVATSPAALKGYLGIGAALAGASLNARTQERIALAVAEANGCGYCLSAHTYLGRHVAKLEDAEIAANRQGTSTDAKAAAAVRFAAAIVRARGHVTDAELASVRAAGYGDAEIVEIVLAVALNTFTNYVNEVAKTDVDFPAVLPGCAA